MPDSNDGLQGNRQLSLTPFPNLHLQSGPLSEDQLPWYHKPKRTSEHSFLKTLEWQSSFGGSDANGLANGGFGLYNSLQLALPFWREKSIGLQVGGMIEPTSYPQVLGGITAGFFRRGLWTDDPNERDRWRTRLSWGTVLDGIYDSEHRSAIAQVRTQFGYSLAPHRECGFWYTFAVNDDPAPVGSAGPVLLDTSAMLSFYYRHAFRSELDVTVFVGNSEHPGGAFAGTYITKRLATQVSGMFSAVNNFSQQGAYAVFAGLRFQFWPTSDHSLISGNPENRYRPFLRTVDHIQWQYRIRPR